MDLTSLLASDDETFRSVSSYFRKALLQDDKTERQVAYLRQQALDYVAGGQFHPRLAEFLTALGAYCEACEYILPVQDAEKSALSALKAAESNVSQLIQDCYRRTKPLDLPRDAIDSFGSIKSQSAIQVGAMYEENPYPRWERLPSSTPDSSVREDILIAGCGTGLEPIYFALNAPNSRITAVDLSLTSLAYALKKTREARIKNIEYLRGDMNEIGVLGKDFDKISAYGSVHHNDNPVRTLASLRSVLRPGGTLKLGVYSRAGRQGPLAAIAIRQELGIESTNDGIRRFREVIRKLPLEHPARTVIASPDFYSFSGCRDLLFHVCEHNYSLAEVGQLFDAAGLKFVSIKPPRLVVSPPAFRDFSDWIAWDAENPGAFGYVYQVNLTQA